MQGLVDHLEKKIRRLWISCKRFFRPSDSTGLCWTFFDFFLYPSWNIKSRTRQHIPAAPMPNAEATNLTERSCSVTSRELHSRTALTSTSYYNFIATDYQPVSPNLFQNYCSARQSPLLCKLDLWGFFVPRYIILYFTKLKYLLFACASVFTDSPNIINNNCFLLDLSWKR